MHGTAPGPMPLSGIRVLDLTTYIAGPFAASLLADLGAEVVKVEPPGGDPIRAYPSTLPDESRVFLGVNRGKQGIVLDLREAGDRAALLRLVESADVLLENYRPGVAERLGIGVAALRAINPELVHLSLTGFGRDGPMAQHAGFDQVLQAMTGLADFQARAGDDGVPRTIPGSVVDYYAAALSALGIVAALYERRGTGRGEQVGVSLLGAAMAMQAGRLVRGANEALAVDRDLSPGGVAGIHPTADGWLYLQASTPRFWAALCEGVGLPQLAADPRYDTPRKRAAHAAELLPPLRTALLARTAVEWEAALAPAVPCAAVRPLESLFEDAQVRAQGLLAAHQRATDAYVALHGPIRFGDRAGPPPRGAPGLGEHNAALLRGWVPAE